MYLFFNSYKILIISCVTSLMDGLKQTQIKANPLLKDALEAEAKLKDNSFEKFFSDHQYSMGPLPKESRVTK